MQAYNTTLPNIILPQYGRNLQRLVDYCITLADREERTRYARGVVSIMRDLYLADGKVADEGLDEILWNHLALVSNYQLDIDYPVEILRQNPEDILPKSIAYPQSEIAQRTYGKVVSEMLKRACELPDAEQRVRLFELCANQMKREFLEANPTAEEDDDKIIADVLQCTEGRYEEEVYSVFLHNAKQLAQNEQYDASTLEVSKKKKKKKK